MSITPKQQINIKLDLTQGWMNNRAISLKQADNETRFLVIRLTNLLPLNITGYLPVIFIKRADDQILKGLGQVLNAENGELAFKLKSEHLAINGSLVFEVVLTKDETKIMSFPHFTLSVVDSIHDEDVFTPSEDDMSILWEALGKIQSVVPRLEQEYKEFELGITEQFQSAQELRDEAFTQSEALRTSTFNQSENTRATTFTQNEQQRNSAFTQAESQRNNTFTQAEETRKTSFEHSEAQRNEAFASAELERDSSENIRKEAETQRQFQEQTRQQAETDRQQAEEERRKEFAIMEEKVDKVYDSTITLSYVIVE